MQHRYFQEIDFSSISSWLHEMKRARADSAIFALLPESEKDRVAGLQALFNECDVTLLGAIFPALVNAKGFVTRGITFLCLPQGSSHFLVDGLDTDSQEAARLIAQAVRLALPPSDVAVKPSLFMVFDSMLQNTGSILSYLFDRLGTEFTYVGVNAGSETFQPMPCLFDNQGFVANAVLGFSIDTDAHVAVRHAYPLSKPLMRASSTQGNRIDKIDGQPAMTAYQQVIASEFGVVLTKENFYDYAVHYPFGLIGSLDVLVRIPVAFNDDGSIFCVGEVPPNSMLRLLKAPSLSESTCVSDLVDILGGQVDNPLIAFYCAGRRMHFGSEAATEIGELIEKSGAINAFGALSLGEISTDSKLGFPQFHNAAVVCIR